MEYMLEKVVKEVEKVEDRLKKIKVNILGMNQKVVTYYYHKIA